MAKRLSFFNEPAIQFLWNRFRHDAAEKIIELLDALDKQLTISGNVSQSMRVKFIDDARKMENYTGCRILPPLP